LVVGTAVDIVVVDDDEAVGTAVEVVEAAEYVDAVGTVVGTAVGTVVGTAVGTVVGTAVGTVVGTAEFVDAETMVDEQEQDVVHP